MLDKSYTTTLKTFNPNGGVPTVDSISQTYKNLQYYTLPFEAVFSNTSSKEIFIDMAKQEDHIKKEVELYQRYDFYNKTIAQKTIEQYQNFYYYNNHYFKKEELKLRITQQEWQTNTFIHAIPPEDLPSQKEYNKKRQYVTISREAIRKLTAYSPWVVPSWSETWKPVYIEWQDKILQDESNIIVVDWSRQIWKSLTIAEKAVENSFIPNQNTLVWAFIKKSTDVIRNYILKHIKNFPEWIFVPFKSEWYILNTKSWSKIYFRSLWEWAENILWLTLHCVIVDEAQLIPTETFEDVLEPTLATTDWKMILIWTPWRTAKWYYYDLIMEAKKWIEIQWIKIWVKVDNNPDLSYYQIDVTQNPLIAPRLRKKVMDNQSKWSIQRQYFCNWHSWEDQLFNPAVTSNYPQLSDDWFFTITFDPARPWTDRSAFCVSFTYNWMIYIVMSWFVPKEHKIKWSKQIKYYAGWLIKNFSQYKNLNCWVDLRAIWEWFTEAWKNHFKKPNTPLSLIEVTYTTWNTETIDWLNWTVSKTLLISNAVDHIEEWVVTVLKTANPDLLEEFQFAYEDKDRKWFIAMKTTFKDDIINAFMVNLYIIFKRWYLKRSIIANIPQKDTLESWNECFNKKEKKPENRHHW